MNIYKKKVNQRKAGAIISYISLVLGYFISIIYTPIMLRLLGQSEYGLYNLVASVVAYLGLFNFGFGSAYIRYYSKYKSSNDNINISKINGMFLIIFLIIGFISLLSGIILSLNTAIIMGSKLTIYELSIAKVLMIIMVINISLSFPNLLFNSYITANEKFIFQKSLQIIKVLANPFLVLPVLFLGYGSIGMIVIISILNIFVDISNIIFCYKKLNIKFSFKKFDFVLMREMILFSSFIFLNMIVNQINWNVDKFILGRFNGTIEVAIYGLASQLNSYYQSISTTISHVFIPKINKIVCTTNNNIELTNLFTRVGRMQFIILSLIFTGLIFFGSSFINLWAGLNYKQSYKIALILILPMTIPLIQNLGIEIQQAKNMHKFRSCIYFLIALINVIISIPLAKKYGGVGTALGTAISLLVGNGFLMNWYYHYKIGLDIKYFWSQILKFVPSLVIPVIFGIFLNYCFDLSKIYLFLLCCIIYTIIFSISMWLLGMNKYEKNLFIKPLKNVMFKFKIKSEL